MVETEQLPTELSERSTQHQQDVSEEISPACCVTDSREFNGKVLRYLAIKTKNALFGLTM